MRIGRSARGKVPSFDRQPAGSCVCSLTAPRPEALMESRTDHRRVICKPVRRRSGQRPCVMRARREGDKFEPNGPCRETPGILRKVNSGDRRGAKIAGVPMVRIHLPPAASPIRTSLTPDGTATDRSQGLPLEGGEDRLEPVHLELKELG